MSMKKTDLAKNLAMKIGGRMKVAPIPGRYGQANPPPAGKREQRRLDAAAGLVPFACKLPADLVSRLGERAAAHDGGLNALVADLLERGMA